MAGQIPESDWSILRDLKTLALDRYCQRLLAEVEQIITTTTASHHEKFLKVFRLIIERNKELGHAFDDIRRSNALVKLIAIRSHGLLTDEEFSRFTSETREAVDRWLQSDVH
jgi:hypothetical protein